MTGGRGLSYASAGTLLGILDSRDAIKTPKQSSVKKGNTPARCQRQ